MSLQRGGEYETVDMQVGATATGNGTAATPFSVTRGSYDLVTMQVTGVASATIVVEGTVNSTHWSTIPVLNVAAATIVAEITADGIYRTVITGLRSLRARISEYASGSIAVKAHMTAQGMLGLQGEISAPPTPSTAANLLRWIRRAAP